MADAETILRGVIDTIARDHHFDKTELQIKAINSGGANYTSTLFLISVKCADKKDVELFAKVACVGANLRHVMNASRMYYLEMFFYQKLSKIYRALETQQELSEENQFVFPKFFGCNTNEYEETIVLENLVAKGYESYNRFISVDWDHAASSMEALARFHALSFAYQKDNPEEFEAVSEDLVFVEQKRDDATKEMWGKFIERALGVVQEEYKPRLLQFLETMGTDGIYKFKRPLGVKVIIHGDYRPSNMLFKRQGDKVHAIPVDYQTIHVGSPAADLMYFQLCGTDSKFRAKYSDRLIEHYHTELSAALQRLGVDVNEVYPREVLDSEMKEMTPMYVPLGIFLLPIVLVETEQAPRVDGDSSLESFMVPSNELYAERFSGLVEDCVKWGAI